MSISAGDRSANQGPARLPATARATRLGLPVAVALVTALLVATLAASAAAAPAGPTITRPAAGSTLNDPTPRFVVNTYTEPDEIFLGRVVLDIYAGSEVTSDPVERLETSEEFEGSTWSVVTKKPLTSGVYTAIAEQRDVLGLSARTGKPVRFTIDLAPPAPTLSSPLTGSSSSSSSQTVAGTAGGEPGDLPQMTVELYAGAALEGQAPLESLSVLSSGGVWSGTFGGLTPGTYTTRAVQADEAGNLGFSASATFTVAPPSAPAHPPPTAAFQWFPSTLRVAHPVTFVSSSTDAASPITGVEWSLAASGSFKAGKAQLNVTFTTPGVHTVRLRVVAADGLSSIATHTIRVVRSPLTLMQPFPVVRIAGSLTHAGVRLGLLSAQAPIGARVQVTCRGAGCPTSSETRIATTSAKRHSATMLIAFRRFQRTLGAGVILEIRVSKAGRIGKYTRFAIRRGKVPQRIDSCLGPAGAKPVTCPSS